MKTLSKIILSCLIFFIIGMLLILLKILKLESFLGYFIGYLLPLILVLNVIKMILIAKNKQYFLLKKNIITTIKLSVIACLLHLLLLFLNIANPMYSYVFLYLIFPYVVIILMGYIFFLVKEGQLKRFKNVFNTILFWLLILVLSFILYNFFR